MTIGEFAYILDNKFILNLNPMDDSSKQVLKEFLKNHPEEYGLESTTDYINSHEVTISFSVKDFTGELKDTFSKYHVLKTTNDIYDKNTLIIFYK